MTYDGVFPLQDPVLMQPQVVGARAQLGNGKLDPGGTVDPVTAGVNQLQVEVRRWLKLANIDQQEGWR